VSYIQHTDQQTHPVKYNKKQIIKHNTRKVWPLHVSARECHLQGVYEHRGSQAQQHPTSGINRPVIF
jgi:hypothetical protein